MDHEPVAITGMGLISCLGSDPEQFHRQLMRGKSGVVRMQKFQDLGFPTQIAAPAQSFDTAQYIDRKQLRRLDPNLISALVAGKRALEMANLPPSQRLGLQLERCGVLIGSGIGGLKTHQEGFTTLLQSGFRRISPFYCPYTLTNMASGLMAIELGFLGPNYSISTACATSNFCFLSALRHIQRGDADLMLAGGTESCLNEMGLAGFMACRAVSVNNEDPFGASRPWDLARDGFVMAEGAGVLVLESLSHAKARRAPILALLRGGAVNCDGYHMTEPRPDGSCVARCMRAALADSGAAPDDIDCINAHATSTSAGDLAELRSLIEVFGRDFRGKITATKSMIGHALGASGALEAIALIQGLRHQELHPTINLQNPDPLMPPQMVQRVGGKEKMNLVLSNSFGFGGHNSSLVFGKGEL